MEGDGADVVGNAFAGIQPLGLVHQAWKALSVALVAVALAMAISPLRLPGVFCPADGTVGCDCPQHQRPDHAGMRGSCCCEARQHGSIDGQVASPSLDDLRAEGQASSPSCTDRPDPTTSVAVELPEQMCRAGPDQPVYLLLRSFRV